VNVARIFELLPGWASLAAAACAFACSEPVALPPPTSDNQVDDSDDPGGGNSGVRGPAPPEDAGAAPVALPGGPPGIGLDDLRFSPTLAVLLVPAGRTGALDLIDPSSEAISPVGGFSAAPTYSGDDSFGVTSADEGDAIVYAVDRTSSTLAVVDPVRKAVVARATLAATPGYVRWVAPTREIWVTEPGLQQIEVFAAGATPSAAPVHATTIGVGSGPESLEIDAPHARAFTHATSAVVAIDVVRHEVVDTWPNGCVKSRGLAVDTARGWVISACEEGLVFVLAEQGGATLGHVDVGGGVDQIAYDPPRLRLYVPSPSASAMSVVSLSGAGAATVLGSLQTTSDAHCAVTAGAGAVYVCAPGRAELLFVQDKY
jgi:hypothetical protein